MYRMIRKIGLIGWMFLLMQGVCAQTVKTITVSQQSPYIDHLTLSQDARDKDLMVKFTFDEGANTLTVSLISYRSLFVFWDQVRYWPVLKHGKLHINKLPYVVDGNPDTKFKITRHFKKSLPKPRRHHIFKRWVTAEGMQEAPAKYKLVNAIIDEKYNINGKRDMVKVTLHDIFLLDKWQTRIGKADRYNISFCTDLNMQYQVLISRDPCYGMEEAVTAAQKALSSAQQGADAIKQRFGSGTVPSQDLLDVFEQMKGLFVQQFQPHDSISTCPTANAAWDDYNKVVSEVAALKCAVVAPGDAGGGLPGSEGVNARLLLAKARQIDNMVARWLLTSDAIERRDITFKCETVIKEVDDMVQQQGIRTNEQRDAMEVFRQAKQYYKNKCVKQ